MTLIPPSSNDSLRRLSCGIPRCGETGHAGLPCNDASAQTCPVCDDPLFHDSAPACVDIDPRIGVLVAHTSQAGPSRGEICLFPFRVSPITSRVDWDTCQLVLIGSRPAPSTEEAWRQLSPLEDAIEGHRVHIDRASTPRAPLVRDRLRDVDLVVGVDESSVDVIAWLPVPGDADVAILADDVPWAELYGREFAPLDRGWWNCSAGGVQSTLRLAALMGYVLDLGAPSDGMRPIEHLLSKFEAPELLHRDWPNEEVHHARA